MKIEVNIMDLNDSDRIFFTEMIPYVSQYIQATIKEEDRLYVSLTEKQYVGIVEKKINDLKEMIIGGKLAGKEISIKTLVDHTKKNTLNHQDIFQELIDRGDLIKIEEGVYGYSGIILKLIKYFDAKINEFGHLNFNFATEHEYPVLFPINDFEKGRYFETFPHYIMFQTVMNNDLETLNRFAKNGASDLNIFDEMQRPTNVLRNAACVPVYKILENKIINPKSCKVFIIVGKCFRNESDNVFELARLNEFTMKEIVFVGTPEQCTKGIEKSKELWEYWIKCFDLKCKIDTANDSFFASNYSKLKLFQILGDSKQEFKWFVPSINSYIACASANFHRTHFSKPYNIRNNEGTYCHSACLAFGIERMIYALLSQKGINPAEWDKVTYDEISKYVSLD